MSDSVAGNVVPTSALTAIIAIRYCLRGIFSGHEELSLGISESDARSDSGSLMGLEPDGSPRTSLPGSIRSAFYVAANGRAAGQ